MFHVLGTRKTVSIQKNQSGGTPFTLPSHTCQSMSLKFNFRGRQLAGTCRETVILKQRQNIAELETFGQNKLIDV